jgi:hypothetical protein
MSIALPKAFAPVFGKMFTDLEAMQEELGIESCGASMTTLETVFLKISHGEYGDKVEDQQVPQTLQGSDVGALHGVDVGPAVVGAVDKIDVGPALVGDVNGTLDGFDVSPAVGNAINMPEDGLEGASILVDASDDVKDGARADLLTGYEQLVNQCGAMWFKRWRHFTSHAKTVVAQVLVPSFWILLALIIATTVRPTTTDVEPCRTFDTSSYESNTIYVSDSNTGYDTQVRSYAYLVWPLYIHHHE